MSNDTQISPAIRLQRRKEAWVAAVKDGASQTILAQHRTWIRLAELDLIPDDVKDACKKVAAHIVDRHADESGFQEEGFGFMEWYDGAVEQIADSLMLGENVDMDDLDGGDYDEQACIDAAKDDAAERRADSYDGPGYWEALRGTSRFDTW